MALLKSAAMTGLCVVLVGIPFLPRVVANLIESKQAFEVHCEPLPGGNSSISLMRNKGSEQRRSSGCLLLTSNGTNDQLHFWDMDREVLLGRLTGEANCLVNGCHFVDEKRMMSWNSDETVRVRDVPSLSLVHQTRCSASIRSSLPGEVCVDFDFASSRR